MTGLNDDAIEDQRCTECGAAFGWDDDHDRHDRIDATDAELHRNGPDGELLFTVEFECPECGEGLMIEEASGEAFGPLPRHLR